MATNFWELLQQHQGDLTKSGRTVAEYLLQHAGEAQYLSISSLAKECCVAEATVFRFCRALGFEGYHEMRIALAQASGCAPARENCYSYEEVSGDEVVMAMKETAENAVPMPNLPEMDVMWTVASGLLTDVNMAGNDVAESAEKAQKEALQLIESMK